MALTFHSQKICRRSSFLPARDHNWWLLRQCLKGAYFNQWIFHRLCGDAMFNTGTPKEEQAYASGARIGGCVTKLEIWHGHKIIVKESFFVFGNLDSELWKLKPGIDMMVMRWTYRTTRHIHVNNTTDIPPLLLLLLQYLQRPNRPNITPHPLCNHLSGNISATPACNACGQNAHSITLPHPTLSNAAFAILLELGMKNPCPTTLH